MVKLVFCVRRRPDLDFESFQKRWLEVHGPLVRRLREQLPMMKRYVQSHLIPGDATDAVRAPRGTGEPFDGITEVWFDDLASIGASGKEAAAAVRQLIEDEAEFIDLAGSVVFLTEEHTIF